MPPRRSVESSSSRGVVRTCSALLFALVSAAAASDEVSSASRCAARCSAYTGASRDADGVSLCEHYKQMKPFPQLLEACVAGRRTGGALGCALGCGAQNTCFGIQNAPDVREKAAAACGVYPHEGPIKATCKGEFASAVNSGCVDSVAFVAADAAGALERAAAAAAAEQSAAIARMEAALKAAEEERRVETRRAEERARDDARVAARAASEAEAAARAAEAARAGKVRGARSAASGGVEGSE